MVFGTIGGIVATSVFGLAAGSAGATIVGGIIGGGLAFGAQTLLGQYLNRPKARPYGAVQGDIQIGGNIPSQAIYGKAKTKGHRLYYAKYNAGDEINSEVLVLSNGWCDGLEPYVYFYGKKFDLVELPKIGNEVAHYGIPDYWYDNNPNGENCFSIRFYDGRPGQQVDQRLVDETANLDTPWKATSTVAGHAYVVVRKRFDGDHDFAENGNPEMEFVPRGLREYDPRKDSTVAGGSGTHRVNDPATWEWTENPALHRLNYQLGLRGLISNRTIIGEGKTLGQIDLGTYFAAMNVCDALRNGKPTYACSLVVNADDDHTEVLKEFDDAMAGYGLNRRGLSGVIAGAPQLPVLEITRDDIPADRAKDKRPRKSAFELYNHMSGQFTSIEDQWHPASLNPITVNAHVAADGRPRQTSNDFLQVTDPDIAQYLLTIRYRQQRLGGKVTLPVSRRVGLAVSEGEWVEFEGREWLVQRWSVDEEFRFTLTLAETSANVYASEGIQAGPIVVPSSPPINPDNLPNVQNFAVEVGLVPGAGGMQTPALRFTWTPPGDTQITEVRFQYGAGTGVPADPFEDVCKFPERGEYVTTKNVEAGQRYAARCTITTDPDRFKSFSQWIVTAAATDVRYSSILDGSVVASKIADAAITADKLMNAAVTSLKLADEAVTNAKMAAGSVTQDVIASGAVVASKLADLAVTQAKIVDGAVGATQLANGAVIGVKLADQAVSLSKFLTGLTPVEIVAALPSTGNFEGRTAAYQGKLYRYTGGAWTAAVPAGDVTGQFGAGAIADGAVTQQKIADAAIGVAKLAGGAVTHEKIGAGSIYGDVIAAGSITARELVLTDFSNFLPDGSFQDGNVDLWSGLPAGWVLIDAQDTTNPTGQTSPSRYSLAALGAAEQTSLLWDKADFQVRPNDEFAISFNYGTSGSPTGILGVYAYFIDKNGVYVGSVFTTVDAGVSRPGTSWVTVSGGGVVPANADKCYRIAILRGLQSSGYTYITNIQIRRRNGAELIVDGAILASKIAAGAVSADKIAANAVTADKINANAVTASKVGAGAITSTALASGSVLTDRLAAGAVTAGKIAANSITASEIAASAIAASELAVNSVVADKVAANAVTAGKVATNAIVAGNIQAGAVTSEKVAAGAITADKVAANSITGDKIVANSITSQELILADFTNLLPEGSFQMGNLDRWAPGSPWALYETADGANPYSQNTPSEYGVFVLAAAAQQTLNWSHGFQVRQDDEFSISFDYCTSAAGGGVLVRMHFVDRNAVYNGSIQCFVPNTVATGTTWQRAFSGGKVPAGSSRCYLIQVIREAGGAGFAWMTNIQIRRKNAADMIVDGSITAGKLAANAVTANTIAAGAITSGKIAAGAVTADKIAAGAITVGWADIETAVVENLIVETSNIGFAAVTEQFTLEGNTEDLTQSDTWQTVASFTIERAEGVFFNTIGAANVGSSQNGARRTRLLRSDGVVVYENGASSGQSYQWDLFRIDENLPVGQFSYELQCYKAGQFSSGGAGMEARFLYWKR